VSTDSAVDVVNFDSNKWPSLEEEDCTDISLKEESAEFVVSSDGPLNCDITQTKTIVENTKLQQQTSTNWMQKTDQETKATQSENNDYIIRETEGEQESTKEGHRLG